MWGFCCCFWSVNKNKNKKNTDKKLEEKRTAPAQGKVKWSWVAMLESFPIEMGPQSRENMALMDFGFSLGLKFLTHRFPITLISYWSEDVWELLPEQDWFSLSVTVALAGVRLGTTTPSAPCGRVGTWETQWIRSKMDYIPEEQNRNIPLGQKPTKKWRITASC